MLFGLSLSLEEKLLQASYEVLYVRILLQEGLAVYQAQEWQAYLYQNVSAANPCASVERFRFVQ